MIAGLCLGSVDFVVVMGRTKLFLSGLDVALLWLAIVGSTVASLAVFLLVCRPIVPLRKPIWVALMAGISLATLEWALRAPPPFSDGSQVPEEPLPTVESASAMEPNVVLISIDTIRDDHIGSPIVKTPRIDALSEAGVRFEHAFAPIAVTGPSHAAMLTGAGPWTTQMLLNGTPIPSGMRNLGTSLHSTGRRTGAFVSAVVLDPRLGFNRGFEVYDYANGSVAGFEDSTPGRLVAMVFRRFNPHGVLERSAEDTTDQALRWLDSVGDEPVFMWVHYFDPHGPYAPPAPFNTQYYTGDPRSDDHSSMEQITGVADYLKPSLKGIRDVEWVRAQYAGEVSFVDSQIGRLVDGLDAHGRLENTLLVVLGDHGESLGENQVWFNHGGDLDESAIRVPLIFHWPGKLPASRSAVASVVDVAPTIWSLLGMPSSAPDGVDLFSPDPDRTVFSVCYDRTVNQAERKAGKIDRPTHILTRSWSAEGWAEMGSHPSRSLRFEGTPSAAQVDQLASMLRRFGVAVEGRTDERDPDLIERLRALGYTE